MEVTSTIGRRKSSIARIYIKPGKGQINVNDREFNDYFPVETLRTIVVCLFVQKN